MSHSAESSDPHLPVTAQMTPTQLHTTAACRRLAATLDVAVCAVIASRSVSARHHVYATDDVAAWLDDRQYVLGQGPTVDALTTRAAVLVPATDALHVFTRWPAFSQEIAGRPVSAVFAFPLLVGEALLGTAQLHRAQPGNLTSVQAAALPGLLAQLVTAILDDYTDAGGILNTAVDDDGSADIAMAVGMVAVQLATTLPNALARLRGTAYTTDRPLCDVADDVLHRRLHYRPN